MAGDLNHAKGWVEEASSISQSLVVAVHACNLATRATERRFEKPAVRWVFSCFPYKHLLWEKVEKPLAATRARGDAWHLLHLFCGSLNLASRCARGSLLDGNQSWGCELLRGRQMDRSHAPQGGTHGHLPSGALFLFFWEVFPFKLNQPTKDALFSHGHWASEV